MSHTLNRSVSATLRTILRLVRVPALGAVIGLIIAALMILVIRAAENAIGHVDHVGPAPLVIVLITYTFAGAFVAHCLAPFTPTGR